MGMDKKIQIFSTQERKNEKELQNRKHEKK
jgi:hypothetical protein